MNEKEKSCFVKDIHTCSFCGKETELNCAYCQKDVCASCAIMHKGHLYCPTCSGKLANISLRFVGSYSKTRKHVGAKSNREGKILKSPKIQGKDESNDRVEM